MANQTQLYKRSIAGSVGAGMKSVFGGGEKRFYTLVHKISSKYHQAGESQQIIVDQIELGRDPACQVRFDETFATVSRRHAAIVKDGDNWKLVQLSKTNSTYLNGHRVQNEWYLQNGDEIQLSTNGPKLGFIIPEGKKGLVSSINLTSRLNLFRQQALRPYKTALWSLAAVLLLLIGVGGYALNITKASLDDTTAELERTKNALQKTIDELADKNRSIEGRNEELEKYIAGITKQLETMKKEAKNAVSPIPDAETLEACANDTYYCVFRIEYPEGSGEYIWGGSGTAFLLDDGRLVTAQHVVNPFMTDLLAIQENNPDELEFYATRLAFFGNFPEECTCHFEAVSPKGDKISYKWPMTKQLFNWGDFPLEQVGIWPVGERPIKCVLEWDSRDYAWVQTNKKGSLHADAAFSKSMPVKTHLDILGFPMGEGTEDSKHISPIYSESYVAREGLDVDGCILLSNNETDHGNSGGPVLTVKDGKYVVVGILTGAIALGYTNGSGVGKYKGRVVPISTIY